MTFDFMKDFMMFEDEERFASLCEQLEDVICEIDGGGWCGTPKYPRLFFCRGLCCGIGRFDIFPKPDGEPGVSHHTKRN